MINPDEWEEYKNYLTGLNEEELKIELKWLESVGQAKKRGSVVSCLENYTLQ